MEFGSDNQENTYTNLTMESNTNAAMYIAYGQNNSFSTIRMKDNFRGIHIEYSVSKYIFRNTTIEGSTQFGIYFASGADGENNTFYNNLFNNSVNVQFGDSGSDNIWNTTVQAGTPIHGSGTQIAGNYWTNPTGTGFSDNCTDYQLDGFCDNALNLSNMKACTPGVDCTNNTDYKPLSGKYGATQLTGCAVLSQSNTTYTLTADIWNSTATACMNFTATNITLDCQGHTIDGQDTYWTYGMYMNYDSPTESTNTLKNCTITDWHQGISLNFADNNTMLNLTILSCIDGAYFSGSNNNLIANATIAENQERDFSYYCVESYCANTLQNITGSGGWPMKHYNQPVELADKILSHLILCDADGSNITNVTIIGSATLDNNGIYTCGLTNARFTSINSTENRFGIYLDDGSENNSISDSIFAANAMSGITISYSSHNNISNTRFTDNHRGIFIQGLSINVADNNRITNNTFENSNNEAIRLSRAGYDSPNIIYNNLFNETQAIGFHSTIYNNTWNTTLQAGSRVYSAGPTIAGNYYTNSTGNGFSDTCDDYNLDGFCDDAFNLITLQQCTPGSTCTNNTDYKPLSGKYGATQLTGCAVLNQSNTTYYLTADITNSTQSACFNLTGINITLDCQAHTIDGIDTDNTYGIYTYHESSTDTSHTIRNCTITDWQDGISFRHANNNVIVHLTSYNNTEDGITFPYAGSGNNFTNITLTQNGENGIWLHAFANNNLIANATISDNLRYDIYHATPNPQNCDQKKRQ
jgi:parallel beta-helix repeat protein